MALLTGTVASTQHNPAHTRFYTRKSLGLKNDPSGVVMHAAKGQAHDVISSCVTSIIRSDGDGGMPSATIRKIQTALCFDVDADKTSQAFKDENGKVDFERIRSVLKSIAPSLDPHIRYAVRSRGGFGLHIWISIAPFVVSEQTQTIQDIFIALQRALCEALSEKDLGADFGAVGILKDFATWENPETLLFHNPDASRGLERTREARLANKDDSKKLLSIALKETRKWLKARRLYSDLRAERGCAKLFLHLIDQSWSDVCLCTNELIEITGWSEKFALNIAKNRINLPWLCVNPERGSSNYALNITKNMSDLHTRALRLDSQNNPHSQRLGSCAIADLPIPETVEDGQRNTWLYRYALALAVCGVSRERAETILNRIAKRIPGYDTSRNCKRSMLKSKLNFVYKLEIYSPRNIDALPPWLQQEATFAHCYTKARDAKAEKPAPVQQNLISLEGVPEASFESQGKNQTLQLVGLTEREAILSIFQDRSGEVAEKTAAGPRLAVVRHGNRIGIFEGNKFVLLTTNCRNFNASRALLHIQSISPSMSQASFWYPKTSDPRMNNWLSVIRDPEMRPIPAATICGGRRPTHAEKVKEWCETHGQTWIPADTPDKISASNDLNEREQKKEQQMNHQREQI
jgi:hypothetical protein